MTTSNVSSPQRAGLQGRPALARVFQSTLLTGVTDGLFATVSAMIFGATVTRLWQSVSSTLLGPSAFEGGVGTAAVGVLMHFGVALAWSCVFLILFDRSRWIRDVAGSQFGVLKVAAIYGPLIWMVMSLVIIPLLVQRPPTITARWWVQLIGHFPFVGLPIVWSISRGLRAPEN